MKSENFEGLTYSIPQMAKMMSISVSTAYTLARRADFPSFHITPCRIVVSRIGLEKWIEEQLGRKDGEK